MSSPRVDVDGSNFNTVNYTEHQEKTKMIYKKYKRNFKSPLSSQQINQH